MFGQEFKPSEPYPTASKIKWCAVAQQTLNDLTPYISYLDFEKIPQNNSEEPEEDMNRFQNEYTTLLAFSAKLRAWGKKGHNVNYL